MERTKVPGLSLCVFSHPSPNPPLDTGFQPERPRQQQLLRAWSQTTAAADAPTQTQWPREALRDWLDWTHGELESWQLLRDASDNPKGHRSYYHPLWGGGGILTDFYMRESVDKFSLPLLERLFWNEVVHTSSLILSYETELPLESLWESCVQVGSGRPCIYSPIFHPPCFASLSPSLLLPGTCTSQ